MVKGWREALDLSDPARDARYHEPRKTPARYGPFKDAFRHHFEFVIGTRGTLRWNNADGSLAVFQAGETDWRTILPPDGFERNWLFLEEMRHFLAVARGETAPLCSLEVGERALALALSAREAIKAI